MKKATCVEVSGKALEEWHAFCNELTEANSMLMHGTVASPWHAYLLPKCSMFLDRVVASYQGQVNGEFQIISNKLCVKITSIS
jgi:hypothetical protein